MSKFDRVALAILSAAAVLAGAAHAARIEDRLRSVHDGGAKLSGSVGSKLDRLIAHRVSGEFARNVIFPEARSAFEKPDDDTFRKYPGWEKPFGMWKGEFWGKLMISGCRMAAYTHDVELKKFLHEEALRMIALQREDGYLGSYVDPEYVQPQDWEKVGRDTTVKCTWCWNLWCRKYTMWGLLMNWKLTGDSRILEAVKKSMDQEIAMLKRLGLRLCDTGTFVGMPSSSVLKPLLQLYEATCEKRYLDFAREIVDDFRREDGRAPNLIANAFSGEPVADWYDESWDWAKAYEMMSCCDGLLEYYRITGEESVLEAMKRVQALLAQHETNPLFSVGYNDQFANAARHLNGVTEPCDAIHWIRFNLDLFQITGETKYADAIELAFYNAYLAGIFRDGTWGARGVRSHAYHHTVRTGQSGMKHQHCCVNNLPRTIADVASLVAANDSNGTLYVAFYGDSTAEIGGDRIRISGNYPYGDSVKVTIVKDCPGKVKFRIPAWSRSSPDRGTWRTIDLPKGETTVSIDLDMRPRLVDSRRSPTDYSPPEKSEKDGEMKYEWRQSLFADYGADPALLSVMRTTPAAEILRGPLVLAKAEVVGTGIEDIASTETIHGRKPKLTLTPRKAEGVTAAWDLTIGEGKGAKTVPVCDFPSAGDLYKDGGMRFSIWF